MYYMRDMRLDITSTSHHLLYKYAMFLGPQIWNLKYHKKNFVIGSEQRVNADV